MFRVGGSIRRLAGCVDDRGGQLCQFVGFLFFKVIIIITDVINKLLLGQIQDTGCGTVNKISVVGNI